MSKVSNLLMKLHRSITCGMAISMTAITAFKTAIIGLMVNYRVSDLLNNSIETVMLIGVIFHNAGGAVGLFQRVAT